MLSLCPSHLPLVGIHDSDDTVVNDAQNVELPLPSLYVVGGIEDTQPKEYIKCFPNFRLYLVGEELGDDVSTRAAGIVVQPAADTSSVVCETLPEEAVEAVLLRLPAAAQARCRVVCKAWLAMLTNLQFLRRSFFQSLSHTTPPPLCAIAHPYDHQGERRTLPMYKALEVELSYLPEVFHSIHVELHKCSLHGFLCITRRVDEGMHFCLFNPVNQSFKSLPMLEKLWCPRECGEVLLAGTGIATESVPSFKVYVIGVEPAPGFRRSVRPPDPDRAFNEVAIYSSISGEWKIFLGRPSYELPIVACNGDLYTTVWCSPPRLVRLSTERGPRYSWYMEFPVVEQGQGWRSGSKYCLAGHRGKLLFCCDGIWMLDDARKLWVEIAGSCPPDLLPHANINTQTLSWQQTLSLQNVHVSGDLVVFIYWLWSSADKRRVYCPVAYDMLRRFWLRVPKSITQAGDVFQPMPNLRL